MVATLGHGQGMAELVYTQRRSLMECRPDSRERNLKFSWPGMTLGSSVGGMVGIIGGTLLWAVVWLLLYSMGADRGLPSIYHWFLVIPACVVATLGAVLGSYPELWTEELEAGNGERQ